MSEHASQKPANAPEDWYWIFAFPLALVIRYLFRPDGLATIWTIAWWIGSLLSAIVILWVAWQVLIRLRSHS